MLPQPAVPVLPQHRRDLRPVADPMDQRVDHDGVRAGLDPAELASVRDEHRVERVRGRVAEEAVA